MTTVSGQRSPRYLAIAAELRERILARELGPHALLPSERELGEQFRVSRMTARQALTVLESEGHVYRRPPRGTFVAEPRVRFHIGSFTEEATRLGHKPHAQLLWAAEVVPELEPQSALGLPDGATVHAFRRLRLMEDEPIAIETTFFPAALTPGILEKADEGSLWALLTEEYDVELDRSEAVLESIILDEEACSRLQIRAGSPGIMLTRRTFDDSGACVEYARDVYRADRAAFEVSATLTK
jgi:GntR family transcriptional regulator